MEVLPLLEVLSCLHRMKRHILLKITQRFVLFLNVHGQNETLDKSFIIPRRAYNEQVHAGRQSLHEVRFQF